MAVEELTPKKLVERHGGTRTWWIRWRPALVKAGVLTKRGRKFWGEDSEIDIWLREREAAAHTAGADAPGAVAADAA